MQEVEELTEAVKLLQSEAQTLTGIVTSHTQVFRRWRVIATSLLGLGAAFGAASLWQLNRSFKLLRAGGYRP